MNEKAQNRINSYFLIVVGLILILNVIRRAVENLPDYPLNFITTDAVEFLVCAIIAFAFVYWILKLESLFLKIASGTASIAMLVGLATLKYIRRELDFIYYIFSETQAFIGLTFLFVALFFFFKNIRYFLNNHMHRTEVALQESERQLMIQQVDPHFIFNILNSLYSMSLQKHEQLPNSILKLSNLMRYVTDRGRAKKVILEDEVGFIEDYVELQKMRFGAQADIEFSVVGRLTSQLIAPLILITPIENAFKHGYYTHDVDAFVHISMHIDENEIVMCVKNSICEKGSLAESDRAGTGLDQFRRRLKLNYPQAHEVQIKQEEDGYDLNLRILLG